MTLADIARRDEQVREAVLKLRMTAAQVHTFSQGWEFPFSKPEDVWRRVQKLRLGNRIQHRARQSHHDYWSITVFLKVYLDLRRAGYEVIDIAKEFKIGANSRIRADFRFRIVGKGLDRLFFLECQQSALTYRGWKDKLTKYVAYRKRSRPFRVLVNFEDEAQLSTAFRYGQEVLRPHPTLTLFYYAWVPDLLGQFDTATEDVWVDHRAQPVSLAD